MCEINFIYSSNLNHCSVDQTNTKNHVINAVNASDGNKQLIASVCNNSATEKQIKKEETLGFNFLVSDLWSFQSIVGRKMEVTASMGF